MSREYSVSKSFKFAFAGIGAAIKKEPNLRIHLVLAAIALIAAAFLGFSSSEWLILILTIFLVLILEFLNTVFEAIVDLITSEQKPQAKIAKDVASASVLLGATLSLIVGAILFLPKILKLILP
jgi:diacylglycerol kinase